MKIAAMVLGIIGGVTGLLAAALVYSMDGVVISAAGSAGAELSTLSIIALASSIAGIAASALAIPKPKIAGFLMIIAGVVGVLAIAATYLVSAPLLIIGGALALSATGEKHY